MRQKASHFLSVIVPAFQQEKTIVSDLKYIRRVLAQIRYPSELIVVVDGKEDKTFTRAKILKSGQFKVFQLKRRQGKGAAVRFGMKRAQGDYIAFLDAGMEIDPNGLSMLLEHLEWYNADIIVGSKRHLASVVNYPWDRKILSWGYYWLVRLLFGVKIKDTQSGIKIFKRPVLEKVLPQLVVKQYAFDIEILSLARALGFAKIYEAPIKLTYRFGSISDAATLKTIYHMLYDTLAVWYRLKIRHWYD